MADKRIVMEVRIQWVTDDSDSVVAEVMTALDAAGTPSPVDYVTQAMMAGAPYIDLGSLGVDGSLEVRLSGPDRWGIAYEQER